MKKNLIAVTALTFILASCNEVARKNSIEETSNPQIHVDHHHDKFNMNPSYTFMSISTAKPGKLDDLVRIASKPSEWMDQHLDGLIARQVSVDSSRNSVVVWVAFDSRETLYNHLKTEQGKSEHGDQAEMDSIIDTFHMYDLTPKSQRLFPKH